MHTSRATSVILHCHFHTAYYQSRLLKPQKNSILLGRGADNEPPGIVRRLKLWKNAPSVSKEVWCERCLV